MNKWVAAAAVSAVFFMSAFSAVAQTSIQFGVNRTVTPWQVCVFDGTNTCQPFMTLSSSGGSVGAKFNAASSFTGTVTGPDNGTWSSGGFNGSVIGATTPEAGTFTALTATGKIQGAASTTGGAEFNLPQGTAPTSPSNGDIWTTSSGMFARINGSTVGPFNSGGSGTIIAGTTGTSGFTSGNLMGSTSNLAVDSGIAFANVATLSGTQTLSGNKTYSGTSNFTSTFEVGGNAIAFPSAGGTLDFMVGSFTSGHCLQASGTAGGIADSGATCGTPTGQALTRTNDTNVTLTLGGTPATALLQPTSLTLGWSGQLALSRGGNNVDNSAANTNDILSYNGTGFIHTALFTLLNTICSAVPSTCASFFGYDDIIWYGADPTGATSSTTAYQNAWNAAKSAGGSGHVYLNRSASGGSFKIGAWNGTNTNGVEVSGNGGHTVITITGQDASNNWADLSGARNITFRNFNVVSSSNVGVGFFWACTGNSCATSGILTGLNFYNVNVAIGTTTAILYGYGYGPVGGAQSSSNNGGGALSINDSTWTQLHNGTATCSSASPNTCNSVVHLTALNDLSLTSANGNTIGTGTAVAWRAVFKNFDIVDYPSGFGSGSQDNNAGVVFNNVNQLTMIGSSVQCVCYADEVLWANNEGITHIQTAFEASDGSGNTVGTWTFMGGGINGILNYTSVFWSIPTDGYFTIGPGTAIAIGGVQYLTILSPDVGANPNSTPFINTINGTTNSTACGSFTSTNNWIVRSHIVFDLGAGSSELLSCGSIDSQTILEGIGTNIFLASGATDHGTSNPFR